MDQQKKPRVLSWISNNLLSYCMMILSSFVWVYGYIFGSEHNLSPFETAIPRSVVIILLSYCFCRAGGQEILFTDSQTFKLLNFRSAVFVIHGVTMAGVQYYLPLPVTHTLGCTGPLFIFLVQHLYGGASISKSHVLGAGIAFSGIILVANGGSILGWLDSDYSFQSQFQNYASQSQQSVVWASLVLVLNMFLWSFAAYSTSTVKAHGFQTVLHFGIVNLLFSSLAYLTLEQKVDVWVMHQSFLWIGIPLGCGEILFTLSLAITDSAAIVSILGFSTIIFGYFLSVFRYNESLNGVCLLGTVLIVSGILKATWKFS